VEQSHRILDSPTVSAFPQGSALHEWRGLLRHHPNMLLEGNQSDVEATLVALEGDFYPHVMRWGEGAGLPDPGGHATIIVREIATLSPVGRDGFLRWLASVSRPIQVVTTSSIALFPLVERNEFPADLYYRVNVVRLTVS
jgi:transcriptional regulator of aromatic amino acid metabolism